MKLKMHRRLGCAHAFIAITDRDAGSTRFTVYKIRLDGDKQAAIIGRELTLPALRKLVDEDISKGA